MAESSDCASRGDPPRRRGPDGTRRKKGAEPTHDDAVVMTTPSQAVGSFTPTHLLTHPFERFNFLSIIQ